MAKCKNKRNSGLADKVNSKKRTESHKKKLNPFEVHINKEKLKVLGQKSKHDRGLPGVSRAKAVQKRKETLGTEMKLMHKTNTFIDKRIGEKNNQLSAEDKMIARFTAERTKMHGKKSIFNLADDEVLTHRGQTLEQIEKFDDPRSDDEDDEPKKFGGLDDDFVAEGHFGGGMLSRTDSKDGAKSHKDLIDQLIAESKKRKAEKQKEKEQTLDLTEKLDSEWKDLQPVVFKRARMEEESAIDNLLAPAEKRSEDYDKMMRELRFEKRGTPSDGLKTDEKQAKEEQAKLEQWEKERHQRMLGEESVVPKVKPNATKHRSADDLDDNFELEDEKEFMLAYDKDGKPLVPENILKDFSVPNAKPKFEDGVSDTSDDDDEVKEDDEDDDVNKQNDIFGLNKGDNKKGESENESGSEDSEEDGSDDDASDSKDTKKSVKDHKIVKEVKEKEQVGLFQNGDGSDDEDDDGEKSDDEDSESEEETKEIKEIDDLKDLRESDIESESEEEVKKHNLKDLKTPEIESEDEAVKQQDTVNIKSFFAMKSEGDNLKALFDGKTPAQQSLALQKLIKSYDPSLAVNNKDLLSRLFAHLLQYINDLFTKLDNEGEIIKSFLIFDRLVPHLFDLATTNKVSSKKFLVELLKEKHEKFMKNPKHVPDLDTLVFFKLISLLYPTSDFKHPVTSPALIFMSEIMTLARFNSIYSVSRGMFITAIIVEYTHLSHRFVPSAINFLRGILYLCANTSVLNPIQVVPPFKLHRDVKILNLTDDASKMTVEPKMTAKDLVSKEIDNDFKIRTLLITVMMLKELFEYFNDFEAQVCIFESHLKLLDRIDLELYPKKVVNMITKVRQHIRESFETKTFVPLAPEKKKPKALRLYEPDIQEVFTGSKSSKLSREQSQRARLQTKYKKEMKGALREIRRDKAFISSVKIRQKIQSDNIRKEKVKQIFKDASIQQGELNKLKRVK